jgi:hypothetical protein
MSITTSVDNDKQLTTHTVIGEVSFEEGMTTLKQFWEDRPTMNVLWDFRKGSLARVSSVDLERIVDYVAVHSEKRAGGKTAIVVLRDLESGLSRILDTLRDIRGVPFQFKIFRSMEEANQWLDEEE